MGTYIRNGMNILQPTLRLLNCLLDLKIGPTVFATVEFILDPHGYRNTFMSRYRHITVPYSLTLVLPAYHTYYLEIG